MAGELFDKGISIRRKVLGNDYVDNALAAANEFDAPMQKFVTEFAWGGIWAREELPLRIRSIINIAMLSTLGKQHELRLHVRGALQNGVTPEEIREILMQVAVYAGVPASLEAFRTTREALESVGALPIGEIPATEAR